MANNTVLFDRDSQSTFSQVFTVGKQVTVYGLGFDNDEDYVRFRLVELSASKPLCPCPPFSVEAPNVIRSAPLLCCGEEIRIDSQNPYVIIDAPQNVTIQAEYVTPAFTSISAKIWWQETKTENVKDRMRGCKCP